MLAWLTSIIASLALVATNASGQAFPIRPVRIVVPFPAGGTSDVIARSVTNELERQLGQSFVIDNRGGANSIIGSEIVGFTGKTRWPVLPAVPTVAEAAIPGFYIIGGWHGWFAPAKTPPRIANKIQSEVHKALQAPKVREFMAEGGYNTDGRSPAEFRKLVQEEVRRYAEIVRVTKIEPQ